ncbi:intraflagellar transport protein 43 homolog isoform X1 [Harmonia axyridis]|uniref:intraflagellar transport protein 43 homolog isoform X1 n=1 Tax=Harmonia axyridis TaxID=115357 RepID=UPI001E27773D|nr:intraflagellar transport protein 43 homolog isoform X1 [Harmonia axyridis]
MNFNQNTSIDLSVGREEIKLRMSSETAGSTDNETSEPFVVTRRKGGWADEGTKSAKTSRSTTFFEQKRFQDEKQDSDDDIPVIPDIDDLPYDSPNLQDVNIPNVSVKKATYKEIDKDNKLENLKIGDANFGNIGDIDLTLLTNKLYPEFEVKNIDEEWTLNSLALDLARNLEKL